MTELQFTLPAKHVHPEARDIGTRLHANHARAEKTTRPMPESGPDEQPWHQHAARYCAMGMVPKEVAEACGVEINTIYRLRNAPWFQDRVTALMAEQDKDVMEIFKNARGAMAMKLVDLALTAESEAVRLAACDKVLDRFLGKAVQRVESDTIVRSSDPVAEKEALLREIAALNPGSASGSAGDPAPVSVQTGP